MCLYKIQPQGAFSILVFTTPVKTWIFGVMKYAKVFCCGASTRMMFYFEIFAHIDCAHLFCTPFWKSVDFTRIIIYYCFSDAVVDTTTFKIVLLSFLLACTQRCFWHGVFSSWLYVKSYVKLRRKKDKCLTMMEVIFIQLAVVWSVGVVKYRPFWLPVRYCFTRFVLVQ